MLFIRGDKSHFCTGQTRSFCTGRSRNELIRDTRYSITVLKEKDILGQIYPERDDYRAEKALFSSYHLLAKQTDDHKSRRFTEREDQSDPTTTIPVKSAAFRPSQVIDI